jgi:hypothetical protein
VLTDAQAFREPIACTGRQGLWNVPEELVPAVLGQLGGQVVNVSP